MAPTVGPGVLLAPPRLSRPTRRSLLRGILAFRVVVGIWMVAVFAWEVLDRNRLDPDDLQVDVAHPVAGAALLAVAVATILTLVSLGRRELELLVRPAPVFTEIAVAAALAFADTWVYGSQHSQALPTIWPLAAVFTVAVAGGTRAAVTTGIGLGLARYLGWLAFPYPEVGPWSLSRIASLVLFGVAGWVAGELVGRQAEADRSISAFRAREEVARTLHDGVLQTLAVIQRRSDDPALVDLARSQETELRDYLFGVDREVGDLLTELRAAARRAEQHHDLTVEVVGAPDLPALPTPAVDAIRGAVTEALTNAGRHGAAGRVVVYAEPDPSARVFVSVKDDGSGFDPTEVIAGEGTTRSIRGRIEEQGGSVEIDGRPGRGTEVRLRL